MEEKQNIIEIEAIEGDEELKKFDKLKEEEGKREEERKENKRKYNAIETWVMSEGFKKFVEVIKAKGEALTKEIFDDLEERKETKSTKSRIDEKNNYKKFLEIVLEALEGDLEGDEAIMEGEEIIIEDTKIQIINVDSYILNNVTEGIDGMLIVFDEPIYTELDLKKFTRINLMTIGERGGYIEQMRDFYLNTKEEKIKDNAYE